MSKTAKTNITQDTDASAKNKILKLVAAKKVTCAFYIDGKFYKKKVCKISKTSDFIRFENGSYVPDLSKVIQVGRKWYLLYDINNPLPLQCHAMKTEENAKILDVLTSKRTLKALFGNPDKWYVILAVAGLGAGLTAVSIIMYLLAIGKIIIR